MSLYLGIDIGGSSIKGVLADLEGRTLSSVQVSCSIESPHTGWAEQDGNLWWEGTREILSTMIAEVPEAKTELKGIMISGMVPNFLPIDKTGDPVCPAILYRDNRAINECRWINEAFEYNFNMQDIIPKWLWMKNNRPEQFERTALVLGTHSYVAYRLTGVPNIDIDTAGLYGEGVFDIKSGWNHELLNQLKLPVEVLPKAIAPTEVVGLMQASIKEEFGFLGDIPILAGLGDSAAAMLGAGAVTAGDGMLYLGTAATLWYLDEDLSEFGRGTVFSSGHLHFLSNVLTGGESLKWFRNDMQLNGSQISMETLEEEASSIAPGSQGLFFMPHLLGIRTPVPDPLASGSILGLTPVHTGMHIYRALMEGVAFSLYESYHASQKEAKRILVTGGGSRSALWREILANVFGIPLLHYADGDGALGLAYYAAYALGEFNDFKALKESWLGERTTIFPDQKKVEIYKKKSERFMKLNHMMKEIYPILTGEK